MFAPKMYLMLLVLTALATLAHVLLASFVNRDPSETLVMIDNVLTWSVLVLAAAVLAMGLAGQASANTSAKRDAILALLILSANAIVQQWIDPRNMTMRILALVAVFLFVIFHSRPAMSSFREVEMRPFSG